MASRRNQLSRSRIAKGRTPSARPVRIARPAARINLRKPLWVASFFRRLWIPKYSKMIALGLALVLLISIGSSVMVFASQPKLIDGWNVQFDGRSIGVVEDTAPIEAALQDTLTAFSAQYGMDAFTNQKLELAPVSVKEEFFASSGDVADYIKAHLQVLVKTTSILVNGRPVAAMRTEEEARAVLNEVIKPFQAQSQEGEQRSQSSFVEQVAVQPQDAPFDSIVDEQQAIHILTMGTGVQDNWYTVKKGDSYNGLANRNNITVSDICKANPGLDISKTLQPGQKLNLIKPLNWVNVKYDIVKSRQEEVTHKTVEETSDSLYTNQTQVKQQGKDGQRQVVVRITYINGSETAEEILSEQVLSESIDEIVLKGTKTPPKSSGTSSGGTSTGSGWGLPLPGGSYRISSPFGKRTLNGEADVHYGQDMAAPIGTPIYAAKDGVVAYAGSASGYGLVVYIDHGGGVQSRYGHCSKLLVKKGQTVKKGQLIAKVGTTGHSTGPHLHFEVRVNGTPVKPPVS